MIICKFVKNDIQRKKNLNIGKMVCVGLQPKTLRLSGRRSSIWASRGSDVLSWIMHYANILKPHVLLWYTAHKTIAESLFLVFFEVVLGATASYLGPPWLLWWMQQECYRVLYVFSLNNYSTKHSNQKVSHSLSPVVKSVLRASHTWLFWL